MVRPADIPEYSTHNVSKRHSPTVSPSVAARAGALGVQGHYEVGDGGRSGPHEVGGLVHRVGGHSVGKTKLNLCPLKKKSIFWCLEEEKIELLYFFKITPLVL